ncbi:Ger(x)C family spore germination protein [Salibacterium salarium]|uniref:Ger(X)C family spore germination protein n=1 Tax=Salibacterium salarium TaxID=284579 RepID=A0A3R9RDX9_9BACI|nr:Ger(x)C family spore germination protein [Salibacterium salarium]RSL33336.1 Ger(x)C family spore germination protein [Salibacterium salarium]
MVKKSTLLFFAFLLFIPLLSGCWDSLDIEKRANVLGIAIDNIEQEESNEQQSNITETESTSSTSEKEMIKLTAQIAVPGRVTLSPETGGGESKSPVWVLSSTGKTIDDALLHLQQQIADELFLGHLRIIVFNEEVAKAGVERFNDYLRRQPEIRRGAWMAVSREKASKYMKVAPELEPIPALYLTSMVENAVGIGKFPSDPIGIFWRNLSNKGQDAYLPCLKIMDNQNIQIDGLSYFKKDAMIGAIDPIEIGLLMAVIGEGQGGYGAFITIPDTKEEVIVYPTNRRSQIKTSINDGEPKIHVKVRYKGRIEENESEKVKLNDSDLIQKIEQQFSKRGKKSLEKLIKDMQKAESDIFGFGEYIRAKHPAYWQKEINTQENWHEVFKEMTIHVDLEMNINKTGMKAK